MAPPSASRRSAGVRSGSTSGANLEVVGLKQFRSDLRKMENGKRWVRELGAEQRVIAKRVAGDARFEAARMGGSTKHFADAIKGLGGATGARIQIADDTANAAFWGAKNQWTGWNLESEGRAANQPEWVGNTWEVGVRGQGPYAINDTIAELRTWIEQQYLDGIERVAKAASEYWTEEF